MQGGLARMRAPVSADRLEPFAEPGVCVAHLTARQDPAPGERPTTVAGGG